MGFIDNPFTIGFGDMPNNYITRTYQEYQIIDTFRAEKPSTKAYLITGVRGTGKTVLLSRVAKVFEEMEGWIVVRLTTETNMLEALEAELAKNSLIHTLYSKPEVTLNLTAVNVKLGSTAPTGTHISNIREILRVTTGMKKRLLLIVDEAVNTANMRAFLQAFRDYVSENLQVYILMTGLYMNIGALENAKNMTFLTRTPRVDLASLKMDQIAKIYEKEFNISSENAEEMAAYTSGYPYAFQLLGYIRWLNKEESMDKILSEYDEMLEEYSYDKIWSELSDTDKEAVKAIAQSETGKVEEIRKIADMDSNFFNVYRKRLLKTGIVKSPEHGVLKLSLPRFDVFIKNQ